MTASVLSGREHTYDDGRMSERECTDEIGEWDLEPEDRRGANLAGQHPLDGVDAGASNFRLVERTTAASTNSTLPASVRAIPCGRRSEEIELRAGFQSHERV